MFTGGCLCGRVRYESSGEPLFSVFCHCRDCQRTSGTGGVPVMGVPKASFRVVGETKSYRTLGGSQKQAVRNFCANCGSLLFGTPEVIPDVVTIYVGSLDDLSHFTPEHAMFTRDRPEWCRLKTELPEHETVPK